MSVTIVVVLLGALLLVIVGINMLQQHKVKLERARRQELAKQKAILTEIEQLQAAGALLPYTNALVRSLKTRQLDAVKQFLAIEPRNADMLQRQIDINNLLSELKTSPATERSVDSFKVPSEHKKIVALIKALKRLKDFIKQEQTRGSLNHDEFVTEAQRINQLQLRINATVLLDRAKLAAAQLQNGSARQHLGQLAKVLSQATNDEQYQQLMQQKAKELLDELTERQQSSLQEHVEGVAENAIDDLDELFSPKKKW
ncbi:hypothetical protein [Ferrimonas lipolytica]|uniref:DNA repair protein n=1 Tax=Ferrimonas lipolytica TaxID=2724191 RepID=A0A6H1UA24_9GAMM|nr:hypothetical protein [Ferrimonas lipolytica]QIZ75884.1 hypothetical protein HER31_02695 [Ferrimonas lipolytica]